MKRNHLGDQSSDNDDDDDDNIYQQTDQKKSKQGTLSCDKCSKQFKNMKTLRQHLKSHMPKRKCEFCDNIYARLFSLHRHQIRAHGLHESEQKPTTFSCDMCNATFNRSYNLTRHKTKVHGRVTGRPRRTQFSCRHCDREFGDYHGLFEHVNENHPLNQQGGRMATIPASLREHEFSNTRTEKPPEDGIEVDNQQKQQQHAENIRDSNQTVDESALNNAVQNRNILPSDGEQYDVLTFFANIRDQVRTFLQFRARELGGIKWNLCVQVEMQRDDEQDSAITAPYFRSRTYFTLSVDDFNEHDLNEAMQKMYASLEKFMREGSGWYVKKVLKLEIHSVVYKPVGGSAYLPLPRSLSCSNSLLNIQNQDDRCFLYCLLASLHPTAAEPERVDNYIQYEHDIDMSGVAYPVALPQIRKVEMQNENISINVFTYEDESILPLRITEHQHRLHHINLLWLINGDESHYCLITNLNRFLSRTKTHNGCMFFCPYCLHGFRKENTLQEHQPYCSPHGPQRVELPIVGKNDILKFKDYEKTLKVPFVIYADFETINRKLHTCAANPEHSATAATTKLEVCGFGYKVVCEDDQYSKPTVIYRGPDAGMKMIECLLREQEEIQETLSNIKPMNMTKEQASLFDNATHCCICKKPFSVYDRTYDRVVRHHNHLTGDFIGPACNSCNLACRQAKFLPVIFHNLKNFDAHILCEQLGHFKEHRLRCIAQNSERYVSFSLGRLRFIDSFQFLPASLENLVENLAQDGLQVFPSLLSETESDEEATLLLRKGVYPYDYMDSFEKFEEQILPPKVEFYSTIKKEHISHEDYEHAQTVFETFNMTSLGQYHDLYLKMDVALLSDVFESFRKVCLAQYELDPCHFYTSPGLSWSGLLKMTEVELELLTDIDKVLMIETGIRGGLSQISNRYKKANNPYLEEYDSTKPTSYLQYLDANNLYGWAMVQPLPIGDFVFMEDKDIESLDVMAIPETGEVGYILEVSLHYPRRLHTLHNCLPLAPEQKLISNDQLSPYARQLLRKLFNLTENDPLPTRGRVEKLLATLEDKHHYVVHYRNLQLYVQLGMEIKAIYRVLKFRQEAWMKSYIDFNTEMRKKAASTFQKNFYKLMNVSVFGKTMENVRRHKNIELVHTEERLKKCTAKSTYKHTTIFNEDLVAVELRKAKVDLFKPIYCGMCILDLSKCLMYDFWYNYIKKKYGNTAQLQMTDTDSVLFSCETEDVYEDMKSSMMYFDTSDYPKEHTLHSQQNKKVLGKMKDETNGKPIAEFVGLRSKMYSFLCDNKEEKRAKGISKVTVKKDLKHEHYRNVLFDESSMISSMTSLRSHKHELFGENIRKRSLSAFDDKRYLINPVESYAYGHYKTYSNKSSDNEQLSEESDEPSYSITPMTEFLKEYRVDTREEQSFMMDGFKCTPCVKLS